MELNDLKNMTVRMKSVIVGDQVSFSDIAIGYIMNEM